MRPVNWFLAIMCFLALRTAEAVEPADPLFASNDVLTVTISAPLNKVVRNRSTTDYESGTFQLVNTDGTVTNLDVKIRARGNFRREECLHPPAWLNFRKSQVRGTVFENQDKLKLVVHCERSPRYEQFVLREYLAYRVLNELTNNSFRVRLLRVTYVDTEDNKENPPRWAFLIEHKKRLAKRIERKPLNVERIHPTALDGDQLNLVSVFQYLIGNTDFSPIATAEGQTCCHNFVLLNDETRPVLPVPYDFDQSGFVDAPYAQPDPRFRIRTVRTRVYRGRCANNDRLPETLQQFREKHDAIYALIDEQQGLKTATRQSLINYVDDFYKRIYDPRTVSRRMVDRCIGARRGRAK